MKTQGKDVESIVHEYLSRPDAAYFLRRHPDSKEHLLASAERGDVERDDAEGL